MTPYPKDWFSEKDRDSWAREAFASGVMVNNIEPETDAWLNCTCPICMGYKVDLCWRIEDGDKTAIKAVVAVNPVH